MDTKKHPTRLVLAFDSDCGTCSSIANEVRRTIGDKIDVKPLRDPDVTVWRQKLLGDNAKWTPTLLEVGEEPLRAWTGLSMGRALSVRVGVRDSLALLRVLGNKRTASDQGNSGSEDLGRRLSRANFLRFGAIGGAITFTSMVAPGLVPSAWANSRSSNPTSFRSLATRSMSSELLQESFERMKLRPEVFQVLAELNAPIKDIASATFAGSVHQLSAGNSVRVTSLVPAGTVDRVVVVKEFEKPYNGVLSETRLWRVAAEGHFALEKLSFDGNILQDFTNQDFDPSRVCPSCNGRQMPGTICGNVDAKACASCVKCVPSCASAGKTGAGTLACSLCFHDCGGDEERCCTGSQPACVYCGPM